MPTYRARHVVSHDTARIQGFNGEEPPYEGVTTLFLFEQKPFSSSNQNYILMVR